MLCCEFGSSQCQIQSWLRDYDKIQSLAVILIYIQIGCALVGSLGALYNGVLLINLGIALFALVAIESSSQSLGRTYALLLFCAIVLDILWFILFSHEIWCTKRVQLPGYGAVEDFGVAAGASTDFQVGRREMDVMSSESGLCMLDEPKPIIVVCTKDEPIRNHGDFLVYETSVLGLNVEIGDVIKSINWLLPASNITLHLLTLVLFCRNISSEMYGALVIFSVKVTLSMQIIGFGVRLSSSLLWIQMYRLGVSLVEMTVPREADIDLRNSFLNPATPALVGHSGSDDALGGSIYDPVYYSSLFEDGQELDGHSYGGHNPGFGETGSGTVVDASRMKPIISKSFQAIHMGSRFVPSRSHFGISPVIDVLAQALQMGFEKREESTCGLRRKALWRGFVAGRRGIGL
ncbi:hypothetical protein RJ639_042955 [Escallonia herrerae]|uniref:Uncharacterized protein n=1 Tax=Escallonia herrerae TaxID=1293975 RepID=A0AA89B0E2_9ASTE|nr:hypothetical protein RJ639_042955 [Escallonia herrerae]